MRKDLVPFLVEQYQRFGPIFRIRALNQEFVVMAGPEANTFVTQEGADTFSSRDLWYNYGREFGAENHLSALDGPIHTQMRKLFKPAYSVGNLLADIPLLVDIAQRVLGQLEISEEVSARGLFRKIVTAQLGQSVISHVPGDDLDSVVTTVRIGLNVYVTRQMPAFMLRLPDYQRAKRRFLQLGQQIVDEHRGNPAAHKDLVDALLEASGRPEFKDALATESQVVFAALAPFIAGLDTAANECAFMLYEVLRHPGVLARCVEEADRFFSAGLPTQSDMRSQGVLHCAMMETLRLHSIAPVLNRTAARDFSFAGHRIGKGQQVMIATTVAHFLPELYPQPMTFDIERYHEGRREHRQRGAYAPFGVGTHLCLGAGAAEAQIVLVMATLLHLARLERSGPNVALRQKIDPTPTLGEAFRVRLVERRHALAV